MALTFAQQVIRLRRIADVYYPDALPDVINPQTPGGGGEPTLEELLEGTVASVLEEFPNLTDAELEHLFHVEEDGRGRVTLLDAIDHELERRRAGGEHEDGPD